MMLGAFYEGRNAKTNYQMLLVPRAELTIVLLSRLQANLIKRLYKTFGDDKYLEGKIKFKLLFHMVRNG